MKTMILYSRFVIIGALFFFLCTTEVFAQAPDTMWTKTFGGVSSDEGYSVQQTLDGGYIITGSTKSFSTGDSDVWIIKTDENGDSLWTKYYDEASEYDVGYSVRQTLDGGYVISGEGNTFHGGVRLIKTDENGDTVWTKKFGDEYSWGGYSVEQTSDGGYITIAQLGYDVIGRGAFELIKTDENGDTLWIKWLDEQGDDVANSVQQTFDGGYIITGSLSQIFAAPDAKLIKTNEIGETVWNKTLGGGGDDFGKSVQQTSDGGYIMTGGTESSGSNSSDVWVIKTDSNGDTLWTKTFGGGNDDWGESIQQTTDGGYIITGHTNSFGAGNEDVWIIKTDENGDSLWTKTFGGVNNDWGNSVKQTTDGGYIITGYTKSFGAGNSDIWVIKLESESLTEVINENKNIPSGFSLSQNYPNPFNPTTTITYTILENSKIRLIVYDLLGRAVRELVNGETKAGENKVTFNAENLPSGVYFYKISVKSLNHFFVDTKKMILLK
ncbi:MAG: T9SS type A sorting domain-containing protein [Candidatus Cloacimonetes bacterium]|nr:T9SS type A sorting domain-containing protein [Candidatus Cloacimonadota bacterium]